MKRLKTFALCLVLIFISLFTACGSETTEGGISIYYMNALGNGLKTENHVLTTDVVEDQIDEVLELLAQEPNTTEYRRSIPEGVEITDILIDEADVTLYFNHTYSELSGYTEVLVRAAVVESLIQIDGVSSVTFCVDSEPLVTSAGTVVGAMTAESFIYDYGEETDSLASTTLTLYFASADGQSLVERSTDVYYNANISIERLVIDQLISGIEGDDAVSPIPSGTKVVSVTVTDGICYVNFDSTFLTGSTIASSDVLLYSIVDSLTELSNINKVQILVDGGTDATGATFTFSLGTSYERDLSLLQEETETEELTGSEVMSPEEEMNPGGESNPGEQSNPEGESNPEEQMNSENQTNSVEQLSTEEQESSGEQINSEEQIIQEE